MSGLAYSALEYAASLSEFGLPRPLTRSGGWLLEREIAGGAGRDLMGPYPLFSCDSWGALAEDLDELSGPVSVVLVADPLAGVKDGDLRRAFPDRVAAFKRHHVCDLHLHASLPEHHRRHVRRAASAVEVEVCARPFAWLDDWVDLYGQLVERHGLTGIQAFSRETFSRQLRLPGLLALRAERDGATVGMALWLEDPPNAWYHLGAYSDEGYEVSASYALFEVALAELRDRGIRHVDLGGAAGAADADDGLTRFKRGWATEERTAWLCGRVLDRAAYDRLAGDAATDWFPAYRASVAAI